MTRWWLPTHCEQKTRLPHQQTDLWPRRSQGGSHWITELSQDNDYHSTFCSKCEWNEPTTNQGMWRSTTLSSSCLSMTLLICSWWWRTPSGKTPRKNFPPLTLHLQFHEQISPVKQTEAEWEQNSDKRPRTHRIFPLIQVSKSLNFYKYRKGF